MILSRLRVASVCSLVALVAYGAHAYAREIDSSEQDTYSAQLRSVQALNAELAEQVMRSRAGITSHYDPIVRTLSELRRVVVSLETYPSFLRDDDRDLLRKRVASCRALLDEQARWIESFKSDNAVLRNSIRFFPVAASELAERSAEGARVRDLLGELLAFTVVPDPALGKRASERLASLAASSWTSARDADDAAVLASHARIILDRKPKVDELTQKVLAVPLDGEASELENAYSALYRAALRDVAQRRTIVFSLALVTFALFAGEIVLRTKRSARATAEASENLKAALDAQKELNMLKSRFVSMASHEFRTPLSAILSSAELLAAYGERWPPDKKAEHFERIEKAVRGMADLLDRILVIGRSDAGLLEFDPHPLDLERFCRNLVEASERFAGPGQSIRYTYAGPRGERNLDEKLLGHVLSNLISNALKYSQAPITFEVTAVDSEIVFRVQDHGVGIPQADLPHLFESFHRGRNVAKIAGTGLGLAIVKRSVDLHGGSIQVDSEIGKGTSFVVRVPEGVT